MSHLALERRSQPAQILDLQARHSKLTEDFAKDSSALHAAWKTLAQSNIELHQAWKDEKGRREHVERAFAAFIGRSRWQRLRWLLTGS